MSCLIRVRGLVQGVGFRPYVWRLARELGLRGWVRNDGEGVSIAVAGSRLAGFIERLPLEAPRLARIDDIEIGALADALPDGDFAIADSGGGALRTAIGPDAAICPDCIADICDPQGPRWRYAFTTCTHCGPRYTVTRRLPYDRPQTSLAGFPLCPRCAAEYAAPADRRFHAETTCCPDCGPRLRLLDAAGREMAGDPVAETLAGLRAGRIVAIKGLGGFHLACDARNGEAVGELRRRKQREAKPFAVMGLNEASFADWARVGEAESLLLRHVAAPIVLCAKACREAARPLAGGLPENSAALAPEYTAQSAPEGNPELPGVAPGLAWLGLTLPATPLHLLLWHEAAGRPAGTAWLARPHELLLVMTSANPHGEPLVAADDEALQRLAGIADLFLTHDRDIVVRCDDSVLRATPAGPAFLRRARGFVPVPVPLAADGPPVLALGAYLKNAVCVAKGREAFLSQHVGGLDNAAAVAFHEETVAHLLDILQVRPAAVAHDLHPDFPSTRFALRLAETWRVPALAVAHHHAHIAALCAEHGVEGPVVGLAIDGVGLGPDGGAWGGELLLVDGARCERLGHVAPLRLPGGDRAAREPWRMALAALHDGGLAGQIAPWLMRTWPGRDGGPLLAMLARGLRCPPTSSLGRWFDAAAGLLGVRDVMQFEGQAAMELEGLAAHHGPLPPLADGYRLVAGDTLLDLSPLLPHLLACDEAARGAALFHATLAAGLADWAGRAARRAGCSRILVGGGCALNAILIDALRGHLRAAGLDLLEARLAPANDGGLALGQAWLARLMLFAGD